jgi:hypothetical protein
MSARPPDPLPWRALARPLARLDERLARSPIRDGWIARTHFADAAAALWLEGELVCLEDLVLHDAGMDVRAPTHELTRAHTVLRARRRVADAAPGWALSSGGLEALRGRAGEGDREEGREGESEKDDAYGEAESGDEPGVIATDERLADVFAAVDAGSGDPVCECAAA